MSGEEQRRPPIPVDLRRRVLVEAGHRCAIPSCRYIEVEVHHITPWASCKAHEYENLIALCPNCHRRADRGEIDRKSLHLYKMNLRFAHDKYSNFELDFLFELNKAPISHGLPWPEYQLLLLKRILDSNYVIFNKPTMLFGIGMVGGMVNATPGVVEITPKGRAFVESLKVQAL